MFENHYNIRYVVSDKSEKQIRSIKSDWLKYYSYSIIQVYNLDHFGCTTPEEFVEQINWRQDLQIRAQIV